MEFGSVFGDAVTRRRLLAGFAVAILVAVLSVSVGIVAEISGLTVFGIVLLAGVVALVGKVLAGVATHLSGSIGRLTRLNERYDETEQWLEQFDRGTRSAFTALSRTQNEIKDEIKDLKKSLELLGAKADKAATQEGLETSVRKQKELAERIEGINKQSVKLSKRIDESVGQSKELSRAVDSVRAEQERSQASGEATDNSLKEVRNELEQTKRDLRTQVDRKVESLSEQSKTSSEKLNQRIDQSNSLNSRLRGDGYVQFNRLLSGEFTTQLTSTFVDTLGRKIEQGELRYLERKVQQVEAICEGRMATNADDAVARILAARSCKADELKVLEIGVLFGVAAGLMHVGLAPFYERVHLSLLDPFDGYYGPDHLDPLTGQRVTRDAVERNLRRLAIEKDDVTILEGFSTNDDILKKAKAGGPYHVIVIDGDHSYEGVKADFERYAGLVESGGVLIVDDYGSDDWPDVTKYVDETIAGDKRFEQVGILSRTAIFRRKEVRSPKKPSPKKEDTPAASNSAKKADQKDSAPAAEPTVKASKKASPKKAAKKAASKKATRAKTSAKKASPSSGRKTTASKKAVRKSEKPLPEPKASAKATSTDGSLADEIRGSKEPAGARAESSE